jgi:hypothetical protein
MKNFEKGDGHVDSKRADEKDFNAHFVGLLRREADHSPPSSSEVKNGRTIPSLSHTSLWRVA